MRLLLNFRPMANNQVLDDVTSHRETNTTTTTTGTTTTNSSDDDFDDNNNNPLSHYRIVALGAGLLIVGSIGFYYLPGMISDDADGSRIINSIYCSAITLTTIGYGDICPGDKLTVISKIFLVLFAFSGLGFFCGPLIDVTSDWTSLFPGGFMSLATLTIGLGAMLFTTLEGISQSEAIYASVIAGTTIGYGDFTPRSDLGKLAVAAYAVLVLHVVAALLEPGRHFLESFCRVGRRRQVGTTGSSSGESAAVAGSGTATKTTAKLQPQLASLKQD